jgi:hypothetical protein
MSNKIECPVCKAAGKLEIGHLIRNDKGKVVCPTLLEQSCRHCGQKGHTPKYCFVKKQEERNGRRTLFKAATLASVEGEVKKKKNPFAALDTSFSEDEEVEEVIPKMTPEEMRHVLCEILGINRRNAARVVTKERGPELPFVPKKKLRWSEMLELDSDDE